FGGQGGFGGGQSSGFDGDTKFEDNQEDENNR
ncbi:RNA chaperone Hfq, partial [Acinetobacter ursingii]|nr:RNA chaperone Hfq [Acinetobacter ursingii]